MLPISSLLSCSSTKEIVFTNGGEDNASYLDPECEFSSRHGNYKSIIITSSSGGGRSRSPSSNYLLQTVVPVLRHHTHTLASRCCLT
jgi:hypothetical protein